MAFRGDNHRGGKPHNLRVRQMATDLIIDAAMPAIEFRTAYDQLKPTERAFVDCFIATDDPFEAAKAAFPQLAAALKADGRTVSAVGARAMDYARRPLVQAAIAERMASHMNKWELTTEKVLAELAKIVYANLDDYVSREGGELLVDFSAVTRDQMAAVAEITIEEYTEGRGENAEKVKRTKFKLHDKLSGIDKAMKRLGLYAPERLEHSGPGGKPIQMVAGPLPITAEMSDEQAAKLYEQDLRGDDD